MRHIGVALQHAPGDGQILSSALAEARGHRAKVTLSSVRHAVEIPVLVVRSYGRERAQRSNHAVELKFEPE